MRNALLIAIIGLSLFLAVTTLTRGHEWGDDFASYIMQADSILNGTTDEFVEHNAFTIFESSNQIGPVAYPWGYPLILTPVYGIKGLHPLALKLPGLLFWAGFLICLYLLMRTRLRPMEALLLVALFAFNPLLIEFLDQILSDIPFLFFSTLALLLMVYDEKLKAQGSVLLGGVIACAFFIRTTGILLLVSFLVLECWNVWQYRTDREVIKSYGRKILTVLGTFGILWLLYALIFPGGGESYFAQYRDFTIQTALVHSGQYFQVFGEFLGKHTAWKIVYYLVFIFFLLGAWTRRKQDQIFIIYFILWMIVLINWPSWQGPRFIFPLLPIFIYFAFQGMKYVAERLPEGYIHYGLWAVYGFWLILTISFLFTSSANAYANLQNDRAINGPFDPFSREVYEFIRKETPADSVVVFFKPRAMRLMTGHDTLLSTECTRVLKGDYLVLSRKVEKNQQIPPDEIGSCNLPLKEVLKNNRFIVYEIQK